MGANDKVQGKTDITVPEGLTEIGILLYPRAQMSAVLGCDGGHLVSFEIGLLKISPKLDHTRINGR